MDWFLKRVKEPSTWAGLGVLVSVVAGMTGNEEIAQVAGAAGQAAGNTCRRRTFSRR